MNQEQLSNSTPETGITFGFGASRPTTILVVEDNLPLCRLLADLLEAEGYLVRSAYNGEEALDLMREEVPNLVLSDVVMPHMDGFALLAQMRSDPRLYDVPVVFLSGYSSEDQRRRAQEWGIEEYIDKPLNAQTLLDKLDVVLRRRAVIEAGVRRRVDRVRNQILGLIQHEFRTPLTLIMGYAEFLQESLEQEANQAQFKESVEAIMEGSRRLNHLVESFLLLANLSREHLPEDEIYALDPTALWRECLTFRSEEINQSGLYVRLTEPDDPVIVYGVMENLREALVRLLDNALAYRRAESQHIRLSTVVKPGYVGWRIQDEGPGIALPLLAELSEPFVRPNAKQSTSHGSGLGLTLARRVAELHGGHLQVESQTGVGSTFTLWVADRDI
jgi:two-component system, sensor histidine kinase and response regulator